SSTLARSPTCWPRDSRPRDPMSSATPSHGRVTAWLARAPLPVFTLWAVTMAFTTYFCMYGYRRPFAAAQYAGQHVAGFDLKTALVISQLCGYALSKFLGIKVNSEMPAGRRAL